MVGISPGLRAATANVPPVPVFDVVVAVLAAVAVAFGCGAGRAVRAWVVWVLWPWPAGLDVALLASASGFAPHMPALAAPASRTAVRVKAPARRSSGCRCAVTSGAGGWAGWTEDGSEPMGVAFHGDGGRPGSWPRSSPAGPRGAPWTLGPATFTCRRISQAASPCGPVSPVRLESAAGEHHAPENAVLHHQRRESPVRRSGAQMLMPRLSTVISGPSAGPSV